MKVNWVNTPEWDEAERHWRAFWQGERLDRPATTLSAPNPGHSAPVPEPRDSREKFADPEFALRHNEAALPRCWYLAEALPVSKTLQSVWCAAYGQRLEFHPDTIWIEPGVTDWNAAPDWSTAWDDPGWRSAKQAYARLCEGADRRWFVGLPPLLVPNDLLSVLRSPENFLIDLVTEPELVLDTLAVMQRNFVHMWNELDRMRDQATGWGNWWSIWCPDRLRIVQSDVSCMISGDMFEKFILPELYALGQDVDHMFYHLDGPDAVRHLEMICSVPKIKAIQWVPGAGQPGHGLHWMWLYKKVQSLGKAIWVSAGKQDLETVVRELDPRLLLLSTSAASIEEGQEIKRKLKSWTTQYWSGKP